MGDLQKLKQEIESLGGHLVAVSKTFGEDRIREVYNQGVRSFGENYLNEALDKIENLKELQIDWHYLGRIQSGTINKIIDQFDLIHTAAKVSHLKKINEKTKRTQKVLIQIRHDQDERDYGVLESELDDFFEKIKGFDKIRACGLMFIPPVKFEEYKIKESFLWMKSLFEKHKKRNPDISILSMGMSGDYKIALESGSTHVRIGRAVFGERN